MVSIKSQPPGPDVQHGFSLAKFAMDRLGLSAIETAISTFHYSGSATKKQGAGPLDFF
jgi:hypothetical protein